MNKSSKERKSLFYFISHGFQFLFRNNTNSQLQFFIKDCFKPFNDNYGQVDFVTSHFVLHETGSDEELQIFLTNAYKILKPGGKILIAQGTLPETESDQKIIAEMLGLMKPLRSELGDGDPCLAEVPVRIMSKPDKATEVAFTFQAYYWSKGKLIASLKDCGFERIKLLQPSFSSYVPAAMAMKLESMREPNIFFIVAEKAAIQ